MMASLDQFLRVSSGCQSCSSAASIPRSQSVASPSSVFLHSHGVNWVRSVAGRGGLRKGSSNGKLGWSSLSARAGIKAVESYDASFQLQPQADETLRKSLGSEVFCAQVAEQSNKGVDVRYQFTGHLFQPVPWSPTTKFGMPIEFERYLQDKENFTIINVPPNFMFNAKIFKPSRLCAIYERVRD